MKKTLTALLISGLVAAAVVAPAPAGAKKAKPVKTTLYFHGTQHVGEVEIPDGAGGIYRQMDTTKPTDPAPKSVHLVAVGAQGNGTPNPQCAGNPLFPVWVGDVNGKIVGDIKVSLTSVSLPATKVDVRVWGLVPGPTACDSVQSEAYVEPAAEVRVDVPPGPGTLEATLKGVNFPAMGKLMVQITPILDGATATRVFYDSPLVTSQIEFSCIPAGGKSCTP